MKFIAAREGANAPQTLSYLKLYWFFYLLVLVAAPITDSMANSAPTSSDISAVTLTRAGGKQTIDVSSYFSDPDGDETLTFSSHSNSPEYVTASVSGSTLTLTPVAKGSSLIGVWGNDGEFAAFESFTATVNNSAPTGSLSNVTLTLAGGAQTIDLSSSFSDADGDSISYGVTSSNHSHVTASVSGSTLTLTPVAKGGTSKIHVSADDGNLAWVAVSSRLL